MLVMSAVWKTKLMDIVAVSLVAFFGKNNLYLQNKIQHTAELKTILAYVLL